MAVGNGKHFFNNKKQTMILLGCPDNFNTKFRNNNITEAISVKDFVKMLVAAYHEARHIIQQEMYYNKNLKNDFRVKKMAITSTAMVNNNYFYTVDYSHNICEIDAEKYGIINAREKLSDLFGRSVADKLICDMVKECIYAKTHSPSFFGVQYSDNVDQIIESLEEKFEKEMTCKNIFVYNKNMINTYKPEDDIFYQKVILSETNQEIYKYEKFNTGWKQLEFMVAINNFYSHSTMPVMPGHILESAPILEYCNMCHLEKNYGPQYFQEHHDLLSPTQILNKQQKSHKNKHREEGLKNWLQKSAQDIRKNSKNIETNIEKDIEKDNR